LTVAPERQTMEQDMAPEKKVGVKAMIEERRVRLVHAGGHQAIPVPAGFELPTDDVLVRREGSRLVIEPAPPRGLLALLATLEPIDDSFPPVEDRAPRAVDL